jgi:hypothetical protein
MPIRFRVDPESRLVVAVAHGVLTDADVFGYQREVWSRPDVVGYDEFMDTTGVTSVALPSPDRVRELAVASAAMDDPARPAKIAVVATTALTFGLGRMFQAQRELTPGSAKQVGIFRTREEAAAFLGLERPLELPAAE